MSYGKPFGLQSFEGFRSVDRGFGPAYFQRCQVFTFYIKPAPPPNLICLWPFFIWRELPCHPNCSPPCKKLLLLVPPAHGFLLSAGGLRATMYIHITISLMIIDCLEWTDNQSCSGNQSPFPDPAYHSYWKQRRIPVPQQMTISFGNLGLDPKERIVLL